MSCTKIQSSKLKSITNEAVDITLKKNNSLDAAIVRRKNVRGAISYAIDGLHLPSRRLSWWKEQWRKSLGNLTLLLGKTCVTFCDCFDHQHGRLITSLKSQNLLTQSMGDRTELIGAIMQKKPPPPRLVAQLVEHRVVVREVVSSTTAGPTLRVLK